MSLTKAAKSLGKHPKSLRYWVIKGEKKRQVDTVEQWREDNIEHFRALHRKYARRASPEQKERRRESVRRHRRNPRYRARCSVCKGMMGIDDRKRGPEQRCMRCIKSAAHQRAMLIEKLWLEGTSAMDIVIATGLSQQLPLARLRKTERYYLPLRRRPKAI